MQLSIVIQVAVTFSKTTHTEYNVVSTAIMAARTRHVHCLSYFNNQLNAQFLYSVTICMLHYNPRHVSSINMPIFKRTNCIITASGIITLCERLYSMPDESRFSLLSSGILYSRLQRVIIPDAAIIQIVLLKMGMLMLETCRGL